MHEIVLFVPYFIPTHEINRLDKQGNTSRRWNLLDHRTVDAPTLNAFETAYLGLGITGWASSWTRWGWSRRDTA